MLVSEIADDVKTLQVRTLALELLVRGMLKRMPNDEANSLINELNIMAVNYNNEVINDAMQIIQTHLDNIS